MYKLTPTQIKTFDELQADLTTIDRTLTIALQYHANTTNVLEKSKKSLWRELSEHHGFDIDTKEWQVKKANGFVYIMEREPKA
jgi:hypothetical protein